MIVKAIIAISNLTIDAKAHLVEEIELLSSDISLIDTINKILFKLSCVMDTQTELRWI